MSPRVANVNNLVDGGQYLCRNVGTLQCRFLADRMRPRHWWHTGRAIGLLDGLAKARMSIRENRNVIGKLAALW